MHEVCSRATHIRAIVSPYVRLCAAKQQQRCAACCGSGCLRLLRCRWLADTSHPSVFHTHRTHPTNKRQAAAGSLARSALAACRHEPLAESARRSPWLPPTAPVPLPRFACFVAGSIEAIRHASISRIGSLCSPMHRSCWHGCANAIRPAASAHFWCWLHRADDTLHVADGVDGRAHEARLPPWLCQRRQPRPVGSLYVRCRIWRRRPLPASAAVRAVRLLPAANAFRPAHRLPLAHSCRSLAVNLTSLCRNL